MTKKRLRITALYYIIIYKAPVVGYPKKSFGWYHIDCIFLMKLFYPNARRFDNYFWTSFQELWGLGMSIELMVDSATLAPTLMSEDISGIIIYLLFWYLYFSNPLLLSNLWSISLLFSFWVFFKSKSKPFEFLIL